LPISSKINGVVSVSAYVRMTTIAIRERSRVSYFGWIFTWQSDVLQVFTASIFTQGKRLIANFRSRKQAEFIAADSTFLHLAALDPCLVANWFNDTQNVSIKQCCQGAFGNIAPATLFKLTPK